MKLQNSKKHMAGKSILVNGTHYKLGQDGVADVAKKDAERLLTGPDWSVYKPAKTAKKAGPQKAAQKPPDGEPKVPPPDPASEAPQEPENEPQEDPAGEGEGEPAGEAPQGTEDGSGEEDPNAWPDPDMSMTKAYLQEMADAYEVESNEAMTKKDLIEAIKEKMYE